MECNRYSTRKNTTKYNTTHCRKEHILSHQLYGYFFNYPYSIVRHNKKRRIQSNLLMYITYFESFTMIMMNTKVEKKKQTRGKMDHEFGRTWYTK